MGKNVLWVLCTAGKFHYSDSDKAKNNQALTSLNASNTNGCD